jgi:predicted nucleotidyltransferase
MFPHHEAAIERVTAKFGSDPDVLAVLLGGSIAHGFANENSDVDVMLVVSEQEFAERRARYATTAIDEELAGYAGGYIDYKYVSPEFIDDVAIRGNEPSRFAFEGATVLSSRIDGIEERVAAAGSYPIEHQAERIIQFAAQLEGWRWMAGQSAGKGDPYGVTAATSRAVLFAGRLLLAHNATLYPFHKWFLRVLEGVDDKPAGIVELMREVSSSPSLAGAEEVTNTVLGFREWELGDVFWANHVVTDSEQAWMHDATPVEDL